MKSLFSFLIGALVTSIAFAQVTPLPNTAATVGLWNFNSDEEGVVVDSSVNPSNGTAYSAPLEAIPGIDPSFEVGRRFSGPSTLAEVGIVAGSKLDFTNAPEVNVQAVIYLTGPANGTHTIFSTDNFRLLIVNNQLAGAVRQPGGLYGVVSERNLQQNTIYRVGVHFKNQELVISVNNRIDARVSLSYPIAAPISSNFRATIGGNILGEYFPGYIDDVRMENVVGIDITSPVITLVQPSTFQVNVPKPNFQITLSDVGTGVDPDSVTVYLNGIQQTSLNISATEISGQMNDNLKTGILNEINVSATDFNGNTTDKKFFLTYQELDSKGEYDPDSNTLALWHMNDFGPGNMADSSAGQHHGVADPKRVNIGEGVFSKGKYFMGDTTSFMNFDGVRFDQKFTFEGWVKPTSNNASDEILFYNGQTTVARYNGGYVRVIFHTTTGTVVFVSQNQLLPVGELHHFAVSWDGSKKIDNLVFFVDGVLRNVLNAVSDCDFDTIPKVGIIGQNFAGMMDEVRVSNSVRSSFNIPVLDNQTITFMTMKDGTSVAEDFPDFMATLNSGSSINVSTVKVKLNGVLQNNPNLTITETGISGKLLEAVKLGLNTIEVEFYDTDRNFKKKSQYFFGIQKMGASEYEADALTAGLWHFNDDLSDSSFNHSNPTTTTYNPQAGWVGNAQGSQISFSNNINLSCRSFTVEGMYKIAGTSPSDFAFLSINGNTFSSTLNLNPNNGNLRVAMSSNGISIDGTANAAFPIDNAFHHVALVYDGSRQFSQLVLLVDGQVKLTRDYRITCDQGSGYGMNLGGGTLHFDEVRISRAALYKFNLQKDGTDKPEITTLSHQPDSTVMEADANFSFVVEDAEGVDLTKTKLFLNNTEVALTNSSNKARFATTFSASLDLANGLNNLKIVVFDLDGNQVIKTLSLYHFIQLVPGAYEVDSFTKFLFHFDELSGSFADAAGNVGPLSNGGWTNGVAGIFGKGAQAYYGTNLQVPGMSTIDSFTIEAWVKRADLTTGMSMIYRDSGGIFSITTDNKIQFRSEVANQNFYADIPVALRNLNYHHIAIVGDASNTVKNLFFLMDGQVISAQKVDLQALKFNSSTNMYIGYPLAQGFIDELRFSTKARYELISIPE